MLKKINLSKDMLYSSTGTYSNRNYYSLEYLIDNSIESKSSGFYWLGGSKNGYLLIDLKTIMDVIKIKVFPWSRSDTYSNYSISISNNNNDFKEIIPMTSGKKNINEFYLHKLHEKCRYIRFNFNTTGSWGDCLNEIEIYKNGEKYLIKQNNQYYSLKSSFCRLGQPSNNEELEYWYKENGIDDLNILVEKKNSKSVGLKLDKNDIYKTVIPIDFNEVTDSIEYINENNKKEIKYNVGEYQLLDLMKKEIRNKFQIGKWKKR